MNRKRTLLLVTALCAIVCAQAQKNYQYEVDLNKVEDDKVLVRLTAPAISKPTIIFHFPKIVPGTYRIADYGKFIHDLKALDKNGKPLKVKKLSTNSWQITGADKLATVEYKVEDTWDSDTKNDIYPMAGTNIEAGKNFVVNPPGFFGYFEGMKAHAFEIRFKKPSGFYAATPLKAVRASGDEEVFQLEDVDHLYDSPLMFSVPDTTTIKLGNTDVLIAVYSPGKKVQSKFIAQLMSSMLDASSKYLGGKLPVDKYAFIFYFNGEQQPFATPGALEHNYSSFYSLPEAPQQALAQNIMDIAAHEFFHIITPLTIQSMEVKNFNFTEAVMSRHLWLYEGTTEYASDHAQVKYGLNTVQQFLDKLSGKIRNSKSIFKDGLSFTELSVHSAGKHGDQFGNVYEKGALIAACLDVYLLHLSGGVYDLADLKHDLSVRFGKRAAFPDDALFDIIAEMTYPEVRSFFKKYVEGNDPIPYDYFFGLAGVQYSPVATRSDFTMGSVSFNATPEGKVVIGDISKMNDFGKKMGYKKSDEVVSINNVRLTPANLNGAIATVKSGLKEGAPMTVKVVRGADTVVLFAPAAKVEIKEDHKMQLMNDITLQQATVRKAWLAADGRAVIPPADAKDVTEIDQLIKALYDVISGPAGARNWERFRSLFTANAFMGATVGTPMGVKYVTFTPEEYIKQNDALFRQEAFHEKELARTVNQFGNIAQVFTTYEFELDNGKMKQRGINSVQLVREQGRWWIASIVWQEEGKGLPIPDQYK